MKKGFVEILIGITIFGFLVTPVFADPSSRAIPISATGELTILQVDDFDNKISKTLYRLRDLRTNKTYKLKFRGKPPEQFRTGEIVAVRGKAEGRVLLVTGMAAVQLESEGLVTAGFSGEQKTIVIVANFIDQSVSCSASDIQNRIFTDPSNQSVDDLYQEMSFGQLWFSGRVAGPFLINYGSTSSCNLSAWAEAADAAARASGVDLSIYNRKVYVMPRNNPCGYTGVATLGGNPSMAWIFRCDGNDTYAHELGHNLGMHHAATPTNEYGDTSDIMGYSGFGLRHVNAPHKDQEGWLSSEQALSVVQSGTYHIAPLELDAASTLDPQILLIPKPDTGESYYLSYRQPIDFDATLSSTYTKGVNIHRHTSGTSTKTYFLSVLSDGGSFTDATNGITITQTSHTDQYVTV